MRTTLRARAAGILLLAAVVVAAPAWACGPTGTMEISPTEGPPGSKVTVRATYYDPTATFEIRWASESGPVLARAAGSPVAVAVTIPDAPPGYYLIMARALQGGQVAWKESRTFRVTAAPTTTTTSTTTTTTTTTTVPAGAAPAPATPPLSAPSSPATAPAPASGGTGPTAATVAVLSSSASPTTNRPTTTMATRRATTGAPQAAPSVEVSPTSTTTPVEQAPTSTLPANVWSTSTTARPTTQTPATELASHQAAGSGDGPPAGLLLAGAAVVCAGGAIRWRRRSPAGPGGPPNP